MKKGRPKKTTPEQNDAEVPSWVTKTARRTTPHTEEEFDLLVDGTSEGIKDTAAWKDLVRRVGLQDARRVLRSRLIANDVLDTMVTWN
jgi:hypothetical protein